MSITAEILLKNKEIIKKKNEEKTASFKIKSLEKLCGNGNGIVKIKSLDTATMSRIREQAEGDSFLSSILTVYNGVTEPSLKDKNLQKGYEVTAHEIVNEIFDWDEIRYIEGKIGRLSGFGKKENEVIEEIKNE